MGNTNSTRRASTSNVNPSSQTGQQTASTSLSPPVVAPKLPSSLDASEYLTIDGGLLYPATGIYKNVKQEWDVLVVHRLIADRRLAPFYRGLQDEWQLETEGDESAVFESDIQLQGVSTSQVTQEQHDALDQLLNTIGVPKSEDFMGEQIRQGARLKESELHQFAERDAYHRGTEECPICMMNYPHNMNTSRCCDQPICTECLVQIKRADPDVNHPEPEAVACPFCVEPDFGVFYKPPAPMNQRDAHGTPLIDKAVQYTQNSTSRSTNATPNLGESPQLTSSPRSSEPRRKSLSAKAPEVVSIDQLYPNYHEKVEAVRAAVQRRANRRIVFRQVGDRLVPVGITSSRDMAALLENQLTMQQQFIGNRERTSSASSGSSSPSGRRLRRRFGTADEQTLGQVGQNLEDMMLNEAIRLSLLDAEEAAKKRQQEEQKAKQLLASSLTSSNQQGSALASTSSPNPLQPSRTDTLFKPQVDPSPQTAFELSRAFNEPLIPPVAASNESSQPSASGAFAAPLPSQPNTLNQSPATGSPLRQSTISPDISVGPSTPVAQTSFLSHETSTNPNVDADIEEAGHGKAASTHSSQLSHQRNDLETPLSEISDIDSSIGAYLRLDDNCSTERLDR